MRGTPCFHQILRGEFGIIPAYAGNTVSTVLAVHQYYVNGTSDEKELAARIDKLWREVDWNF